MQLAERFGRWPWELEGEPTDRVLYYTRIMGLEAEMRGLLEGLKADEPFHFFEDE